MLSSLARCASRGVLQVFKGASRTSRPFTMPRFGHQTLAAALPAVRGSPGVRQARALDHERLLQVEWDDGSCSLYPFTWLRDNCQCPLCTLQSAQARSLLLTDLDVHTGVDQVQVTENNKVSIMWPDQHSSEFEPDWLKKRCFSPEARQARQEELFLNGVFQEQLRRREREREEAETRRQTQRMITPRLAPLRQSKFKTRSYDRPWAASTPDSVKTSPTSVKSGRPDAQHGAKRSSVERLPDLVGGTRSRPAELKASKTSQRAQKNSAVRCSVLTGRSCTGKEQSSQHLQSTAVTPKIAPCKMSPKQTARTARQAQTRRRNVLESRPYVTETPVPQETPRHTDEQTTMDTQRLDYLPRQLTPPHQSRVNWTRFPSLGNYSPSPESEPTPELLNPFQSLPDISSISEDSLTTENSDSRATSTSSADSSVQEVWSSTTSELDSSSLSNGSSIMGPSSGHDLTSEEDEDEGHFTSWHDLRSLSGPSTTLQMSSPARTLRLLSTPTTLPPDSPSFTRYESTSRALQEACASPSNRRGSSTDPSDFRLPALEESPGRTSPELDEDEDGRMLITSLEAATSGPVALLEGWSVSGEADQPRRTSLMDHLNLALVVLHDLCREVTQSNRDDVHTGGNPESKRSSDPETLRRITERLLEEESDEEDEDTCRICQCKGTSPTNPLQSPCQCSGSLQYIHRDCLRRWIQTKIKSGAELSVVKTCELCKGSLTLDLDDFDIEEYYWQHRPTQLSQDARQLFMLLQLQRRFAELLHLTQTRSTTVSGALGSRARPLAHRPRVRR